jgi:capping protein alpha
MCHPLIYSAHDARLIGPIVISQVQLETKHRASIVLPTSISASSPGPSAKKVLALIEDQEGAYQESLGDTYQEMGEKSFKGLRRALPLTRQKLDWDKVRLLAAPESSSGSLIWSPCTAGIGV